MTATQGNTRRTRRPVRLSQRGCGVTALLAAGLVVLAGFGHIGAAALGAGALYLLLSGRVAAAFRSLPSAKQVMRGAAWAVAGIAALAALHGSTAPGGPLFGLALAAALATYLKLSQRR